MNGVFSFNELENKPNRYIQCIYRDYFTTMNDPKLKEAMESEMMNQEIEEAMKGGL